MDTTAKEEREKRALRELLVALALAAVAVPGALPLAQGAGVRGAEPLGLIVWLSIVALPTGAGVAALGVHAWPYGAALCGAWAALLAIVAGLSERVVPTPLWGALAVAGLLLAGYAIGSCLRRPALAVAPLLLSALAATWLPLAPGRAGAPWPPLVSAALLDLSPATLVAECCGIDWLRTAGVYGPSGADRFVRASWPAALAGPASLLVGCVLWALAALLRRRGRAPSH